MVIPSFRRTFTGYPSPVSLAHKPRRRSAADRSAASFPRVRQPPDLRIRAVAHHQRHPTGAPRDRGRSPQTERQQHDDREPRPAPGCRLDSHCCLPRPPATDRRAPPTGPPRALQPSPVARRRPSARLWSSSPQRGMIPSTRTRVNSSGVHETGRGGLAALLVTRDVRRPGTGRFGSAPARTRSGQ